MKVLCNEVPTRESLAFQQKNKQAAPKASLGAEIASNPEQPWELFCMVHGGFVLRSSMDIEHAQAYDDLKKRQVALLHYLNKPENGYFADVLLKQEGISDLLRRDPTLKGNPIKATQFFYKACYNNMENLWLAYHACNMKKSNNKILEWFKDKKFFKEKFINHVVKTLGGVHQGLIFKMVYRTHGDDMMLDVPGCGIVRLPKGCDAEEIKGLGQIARDWFFSNYREEYMAHRRYYKNNYGAIKKAFDEILILSEIDADAAKIRHRKLRRTIERTKKFTDDDIDFNARPLAKDSSESSSSDSDNKGNSGGKSTMRRVHYSLRKLRRYDRKLSNLIKNELLERFQGEEEKLKLLQFVYEAADQSKEMAEKAKKTYNLLKQKIKIDAPLEAFEEIFDTVSRTKLERLKSIEERESDVLVREQAVLGREEKVWTREQDVSAREEALSAERAALQRSRESLLKKTTSGRKRPRPSAQGAVAAKQRRVIPEEEDRASQLRRRMREKFSTISKRKQDSTKSKKQTENARLPETPGKRSRWFWVR